MTFKQLAETFNILASKKPDALPIDYAGSCEYIIDLISFDLTATEIRRLAEIGWGLGSDDEFDKEEMEAWYNPQNHTDKEIVEVFNKYKSIYKYT